MFNRLVMIFVISFIIAGCSNKKHQKNITPEAAVIKITETLYLSSITFSDEVIDGEFRTECEMLPMVTKSILDSAKTDSKNILPSNNIENDQYELKVEFVNVVPNRWAFLAFRPSSNATIKASIIKAGVTLHSTTKIIGSGVAFGACDRLEKISVAEGRYISKWVSKYI